MGGSGVKGDFRRLEQKIDALAHDISRKALRAVQKDVAEEAINFIKDGFRAEANPYGEKWPPRKDDGASSPLRKRGSKRKRRKPNNKKILSKTGRLKTSWKRSYKGDEIHVTSSVGYALPHQDPQMGKGGKLKRPQRMMVPSEERGLPKPWADEFREVAADALKRVISKNRAG